MPPLSPTLLIGAANAFLGLGEETDHHRGRMVEMMLREVGQPPDMAWDVALLYHLGYWSHFENAHSVSTWPLPATADANALASFAEERNVLVTEPRAGDVFVLRSKLEKRFTHAGVIVGLGDRGMLANGKAYVRCTTIEGARNPSGTPGGRLILRITRDLSTDTGDRFVRWVELDPRVATTDLNVDVSLVAGRMTIRRAA
jgi:hypothetical protein